MLLQNAFDVRTLELEDARQRLVQFGQLSKYKSGVKSLLRKELVDILAANYDGSGVAIFNPEYSDEAISFMERTTIDAGDMMIVESDNQTANNMRWVYSDLECCVYEQMLHELTQGIDPNSKISAAHFDFTGEWNGPTAKTSAVNVGLLTKLSDVATLAYTHSNSFRNPHRVVDIGQMMYDHLKTKYNELDNGIFEMEHYNPDVPKCINNIFWYNPTVLTLMHLILLFQWDYKIEVLDSVQYRQLSKTTAKPTRGNVYMNRGVFRLSKGEFDIESTINSLLANNRGKIN